MVYYSYKRSCWTCQWFLANGILLSGQFYASQNQSHLMCECKWHTGHLQLISIRAHFYPECSRKKLTLWNRSIRGILVNKKSSERRWKTTMILENISTPVSAVHCLPWVDFVETQEGQSGIGLVIFVNCIATILTNILLLIVIFSHRESKDQVTSSLLKFSSFLSRGVRFVTFVTFS